MKKVCKFLFTIVSTMAVVTAAVVTESQAAKQMSRASFYGIDQQYTSLRALGMGNAFTAVVDDYNAVMYNPAALARRKDGVVHTGIGAGVSDSFVNFVDDISSGESSSSNQAMTDTLNKHYGNTFSANFPRVHATWARPNWGIVFIPVYTTFDLMVNRGAGGPSVSANLTNDTTIAYGYGRDIDLLKNWFGWKGRLSVGVTGKIINRIFASETLSVSDLAGNGSEIIDSDAAGEGMTVDADLGVLFTPNISKTGMWRWLSAAKPTFSMVIRNAIDSGFTTNLNLVTEGESALPPPLQRRLDFGSEWDLPDFWVFDPHFAVDIKDVLHENWSIKKGLHVGAELYWKMFNWWKGTWTMGLNQGYWTAGVGARLAWFQLDLVTYGEELGTTADPVENRRYMMEMSLDF